MATATRTVLFTDMADYTGQVDRRDRQALHRLLRAHEAAVQPVLEGAGGRIVKSLGDAFLALFDSATDAVRAATAAIQAAEREAGIRIRASCATGDVEEIGGDVFGGAVNLSSRINSRTPEGQAWFSESTRLCMNQAELPWETVGHLRFKGIAGEVPVHRAVLPGTCHLPDELRKAVQAGRLVVVEPGRSLPPLPPDPIVLFVGFSPSGPELADAIARLPVLPPHHLWLNVQAVAPDDRLGWTGEGRGLVVGDADALRAALQRVSLPASRTPGSNTIILDAESMAEYDVSLEGLALPAVPLADVVAGYSYDLLPDGRWVNRSDRAVLRVEVEGRTMRVRAMAPGVAVSGVQLAPGATRDLDGPADLHAAGLDIRFQPLDSPEYLGLLRCSSQVRVPLARGQVVELGREPQPPGLVLPERAGEGNLRWCSGPRAARAREHGFSIERLLAGRRQAAVELTHDGSLVVRALHPRCPTWVLDAGRELHRVEGRCSVPPETRLVVGTFVVALQSAIPT